MASPTDNCNSDRVTCCCRNNEHGRWKGSGPTGSGKERRGNRHRIPSNCTEAHCSIILGKHEVTTRSPPFIICYRVLRCFQPTSWRIFWTPIRKKLLRWSSPCISSFHDTTSSAFLHAASSTHREERTSVCHTWHVTEQRSLLSLIYCDRFTVGHFRSI